MNTDKSKIENPSANGGANPPVNGSAEVLHQQYLEELHQENLFHELLVRIQGYSFPKDYPRCIKELRRCFVVQSKLSEEKKQIKIPCPKEKYLMQYFGLKEFDENLTMNIDLGTLTDLLYGYEQTIIKCEHADIEDNGTHWVCKNCGNILQYAE